MKGVILGAALRQKIPQNQNSRRISQQRKSLSRGNDALSVIKLLGRFQNQSSADQQDNQSKRINDVIRKYADIDDISPVKKQFKEVFNFKEKQRKRGLFDEHELMKEDYGSQNQKNKQEQESKKNPFLIQTNLHNRKRNISSNKKCPRLTRMLSRADHTKIQETLIQDQQQIDQQSQEEDDQNQIIPKKKDSKTLSKFLTKKPPKKNKKKFTLSLEITRQHSQEKSEKRFLTTLHNLEHSNSKRKLSQINLRKSFMNSIFPSGESKYVQQKLQALNIYTYLNLKARLKAWRKRARKIMIMRKFQQNVKKCAIIIIFYKYLVQNAEQRQTKRLKAGYTLKRTGTFPLYPEDSVYSIWNIILINVLILSTFWTTYEYSFIEKITPFMEGVDTIFDIIFFLDIIFTFNCAFYNDQNQLVSNQKMIIKNYIKSWFFIDLITVMPFHYLGFESKFNKLLRLLRLPRIFKINKLMKLSKNTTDGIFFSIIEYLNNNIGVKQFLQLTFITILISHIGSCIFYLAARAYDFDEKTWLGKIDYLDKDSDEDIFEKYITSLYWIFQTLTVVGYGDIPCETPLEQVYACLFMCVSIAFQSTIIQAVAMNMGGDGKLSYLQQFLDNFQTMKQDFNIQQSLAFQIENFFKINYKHNLYWGTDFYRLVDDFPQQYVEEIGIVIYSKLVEQIPFFRLELQFTSLILPTLQFQKLNKNSIIYRKNDIADEIYFILEGTVLILNEDYHILYKINKGDYFGQEEVLTGIRRKYFAICSEHQSMILISKQSDFLQHIESFPVVLEELGQVTSQRLREMKQRIIQQQLQEQQDISGLVGLSLILKPLSLSTSHSHQGMGHSQLSHEQPHYYINMKHTGVYQSHYYLNSPFEANQKQLGTYIQQIKHQNTQHQIQTSSQVMEESNNLFKTIETSTNIMTKSTTLHTKNLATSQMTQYGEKGTFGNQKPPFKLEKSNIYFQNFCQSHFQQKQKHKKYSKLIILQKMKGVSTPKNTSNKLQDSLLLMESNQILSPQNQTNDRLLVHPSSKNSSVNNSRSNFIPQIMENVGLDNIKEEDDVSEFNQSQTNRNRNKSSNSSNLKCSKYSNISSKNKNNNNESDGSETHRLSYKNNNQNYFISPLNTNRNSREQSQIFNNNPSSTSNTNTNTNIINNNFIDYNDNIEQEQENYQKKKEDRISIVVSNEDNSQKSIQYFKSPKKSPEIKNKKPSISTQQNDDDNDDQHNNVEEQQQDKFSFQKPAQLNFTAKNFEDLEKSQQLVQENNNETHNPKQKNNFIERSFKKLNTHKIQGGPDFRLKRNNNKRMTFNLRRDSEEINLQNAEPLQEKLQRIKMERKHTRHSSKRLLSFSPSSFDIQPTMRKQTAKQSVFLQNKNSTEINLNTLQQKLIQQQQFQLNQGHKHSDLHLFDDSSLNNSHNNSNSFKIFDLEEQSSKRSSLSLNQQQQVENIMNENNPLQTIDDNNKKDHFQHNTNFMQNSWKQQIPQEKSKFSHKNLDFPNTIIPSPRSNEEKSSERKERQSKKISISSVNQLPFRRITAKLSVHEIKETVKQLNEKLNNNTNNVMDNISSKESSSQSSSDDSLQISLQNNNNEDQQTDPTPQNNEQGQQSGRRNKNEKKMQSIKGQFMQIKIQKIYKNMIEAKKLVRQFHKSRNTVIKLQKQVKYLINEDDDNTANLNLNNTKSKTKKFLFDDLQQQQ